MNIGPHWSDAFPAIAQAGSMIVILVVGFLNNRSNKKLGVKVDSSASTMVKSMDDRLGTLEQGHAEIKHSVKIIADHVGADLSAKPPYLNGMANH